MIKPVSFERNDVAFRAYMRRRYARIMWHFLWLLLFQKPVNLVLYQHQLDGGNYQVMKDFMTPLYIYMRQRTRMLNDAFDLALNFENQLKTMEHDYANI